MVSINSTHHERMVLLRVEYLKHRRTRVTMEVVLAQFINFIPENQKIHASVFRHSPQEERFCIQQQNRVASAGLSKGLHDRTGSTCHVSSAMSTNFGLIANTTKRDALERPVERSRNRLAE